MASRITLQSLAENLIRESQAPFSADDFLAKVQQRWRRKISASTLDHLKKGLFTHNHLIGITSSDFLPYHAVLKKIRHIPLAVSLGKMEWKKKIFIPGHRLIPFISGDLAEAELTILDPEGNEIPKTKNKSFIEEVISYYQYSNERHFPDRIQVNEYLPRKSTLAHTVWDMKEIFAKFKFRTGDALLVESLDYFRGVFQIHRYPREKFRQDRLKMRSLYVSLEKRLRWMCERWNTASPGLEKQLMRVFFTLKTSELKIPAFSLPNFIETLSKMAVARNDRRGVHFVATDKSSPDQYVLEGTEPNPKGKVGSLDVIFEDMGLPFSETEFKATLYTLMGSEDYDIESVFNLLFGGKEGNFYDKKQHNAFYRHLRKILHTVCEDLKQPEPKLVSKIRNKTVFIKLRLIEIMRYLEANEVNLEDLPAEVLELVADLDGFCVDTLGNLADLPNSPDIKTIRDLKLALGIILPNLDKLEEDIFYRLGIY